MAARMLTTAEHVEVWFKNKNIVVNCYNDWLDINFKLSNIESIPMIILIEFQSLIKFSFSITTSNTGLCLWFETRVWGD